MSTPSERPELPDDEEGIDPPSRDHDRTDDAGGADGAPASGAGGGAGPPGVGEGNSGVGVETEGMPDPPELQDD